MRPNPGVIVFDSRNDFNRRFHSFLIRRNLTEDYHSFSVFPELELFLQQRNSLVLVIHLDLMDESGLKMIRRIKHGFPDLLIVLACQELEYRDLILCLKLGIQGLLSGQYDTEEVWQAVSAVTLGDYYFGPHASEIIRNLFLVPGDNGVRENEKYSITPREEEIITLFAEGCSYKEIALKLNISARTVETHKNKILTKLNIASTAELVKYAVRNNLIKI